MFILVIVLAWSQLAFSSNSYADERLEKSIENRCKTLFIALDNQPNISEGTAPSLSVLQVDAGNLDLIGFVETTDSEVYQGTLSRVVAPYALAQSILEEASSAQGIHFGDPSRIDPIVLNEWFDGNFRDHLQGNIEAMNRLKRIVARATHLAMYPLELLHSATTVKVTPFDRRVIAEVNQATIDIMSGAGINRPPVSRDNVREMITLLIQGYLSKVLLERSNLIDPKIEGALGDIKVRKIAGNRNVDDGGRARLQEALRESNVQTGRSGSGDGVARIKNALKVSLVLALGYGSARVGIIYSAWQSARQIDLAHLREARPANPAAESHLVRAWLKSASQHYQSDNPFFVSVLEHHEPNERIQALQQLLRENRPMNNETVSLAIRISAEQTNRIRLDQFSKETGITKSSLHVSDSVVRWRTMENKAIAPAAPLYLLGVYQHWLPSSAESSAETQAIEALIDFEVKKAEAQPKAKGWVKAEVNEIRNRRRIK